MIIQISQAIEHVKMLIEEFSKGEHTETAKGTSKILQNINNSITRIWEEGEIYQKLCYTLELINLQQKSELEELRIKNLNLEKEIYKENK